MAVFLDPASSMLPSANRVLVCGGRDFANEEWLGRVLDRLHAAGPIEVVIHGGARGADSLAGRWASDNSIPCEVFYADWEKHGRAAGPIRNQSMIDEGRPTFVVAFPGGRGTADMVKRAQSAGIDWMQLAVGGTNE